MVKIENISFAYNKQAGEILRNISFDMAERRCIAILGNNGAGKSTLLKCLDRILPVKGATVYVDGNNIFDMTNTETAQNIAYVPQQTEPVEMTVYDTIMLGRRPYIKWDVSAEDRAIVKDIICKMNLESYALRNVSSLSGGEAQKVMLSRALAQEPKLLLLDEPTSNLDPRNSHEVLRTVRKIAKEHNICVAIIIHDLNLAIRYCDSFLFLQDSGIYSYGGIETMTTEAIEEVYKIHVHIIDYMGIPVIVPFPDEKTDIE